MLSLKQGFLLLEVCLGIFLSVLISSTLAYWHMRILHANQHLTNASSALSCTIAYRSIQSYTQGPKKREGLYLQLADYAHSSSILQTGAVVVTWKWGRVEESVRLATGMIC